MYWKFVKSIDALYNQWSVWITPVPGILLRLWGGSGILSGILFILKKIFNYFHTDYLKQMIKVKHTLLTSPLTIRKKSKW